MQRRDSVYHVRTGTQLHYHYHLQNKQMFLFALNFVATTITTITTTSAASAAAYKNNGDAVNPP